MAKRTLQFRQDGTITIVQFADLHVVGRGGHDALIHEVMSKILEI